MENFKKLDFQSSNASLNAVLFDVKLNDIYTDMPHYVNLYDKNRHYIKDYRALINISDNTVLSVVSKNYHLITNAEALETGKNVFVELFPSVNKNDLVVFKVITSSRKTFCHIDLIHKNVNLKQFEQDTWYPFLRVTNSYNKTFSLAFEIGFVRALCSNGVIFNKKTVRVKFNHTKGKVPVDFKTDVEALRELEASFVSAMFNLQKFFVKRHNFYRVAEIALNFSDKSFRNDEELLNNFKKVFNKLTDRYVLQDGENAYALFNVMSDLVSNTPQYFPGYHLNPNSYYKKLSDWMLDFVKEIEDRSFTFDNYFKKYQHK